MLVYLGFWLFGGCTRCCSQRGIENDWKEFLCKEVQMEENFGFWRCVLKDACVNNDAPDQMLSSTKWAKLHQPWAESLTHVPAVETFVCLECTFVFMHAVSGKVCVSGFCFQALISVSTGVSTGQEKRLCRHALPDPCADRAAWWTCICWDVVSHQRTSRGWPLGVSVSSPPAALWERMLWRCRGMSHCLNGWNKEVITALLEEVDNSTKVNSARKSC